MNNPQKLRTKLFNSQLQKDFPIKPLIKEKKKLSPQDIVSRAEALVRKESNPLKYAISDKINFEESK